MMCWPGLHLKASLELLRCVGLYGDAGRFAPGETDAGKIAMTIVLQQLAQEGVSENANLERLINLQENPRYRERKREILEALGA
jgi:hypothetical protein